jgi:integrase
MSENTINAGLRRLGYASDEMTAHGFRAMASTLLNESGKWHPDAIERALAHGDSDKVRAAAHTGKSASRWRNGGRTIWISYARGQTLCCFLVVRLFESFIAWQ